MRNLLQARLLLSALAAALLFPSLAGSWEVKADDVDRRIQEVQGSGLNGTGEPVIMDILRYAKRGKKPGWARKARSASERVYWAKSHAGKTYYFGVGRAENIKNPSLLITAAQDRARASLVFLLGTVKTTQETTPAGAQTTNTEAEGLVAGAIPIDWYLAKEGTLYTLLVVVR